MNQNAKMFEDPSAKIFNTSNSHPIIPNSNDYNFEYLVNVETFE